MGENIYKDFFDRVNQENNFKSYDSNRWFKSDSLINEYMMTATAIEDNIRSRNYKNIIDVGPGTGIFTVKLLERFKDASFVLIDISSEMLGQAKDNLSKHKNIKYIEGDFNEFNFEQKFDLFFSCRAIEYIEDKELMIKKISALLNSGGQCDIITKNPNYIQYKKKSSERSKVMRSKIVYLEFAELLKKYGFRKISVYPVIIRAVPRFFPEKLKIKINNFLFKILHKRKINFVSKLLAESYIIKATKK